MSGAGEGGDYRVVRGKHFGMIYGCCVRMMWRSCSAFYS